MDKHLTTYLHYQPMHVCRHVNVLKGYVQEAKSVTSYNDFASNHLSVQKEMLQF